jgi:hypothetical protein
MKVPIPRTPKIPKMGPFCIGCLIGQAAPAAWYFSDCGWPFLPGWRDCINTYWLAFLEECKKDMLCTLSIGACDAICGFKIFAGT